MVRDTLMAIGKKFRKKATQAVKEKTAKAAAEKGLKQIQQILRKRRSTSTTAPVQTQSKSSSDAMKKLSRNLEKQI